MEKTNYLPRGRRWRMGSFQPGSLSRWQNHRETADAIQGPEYTRDRGGWLTLDDFRKRGRSESPKRQIKVENVEMQPAASAARAR